MSSVVMGEENRGDECLSNVVFFTSTLRSDRTPLKLHQLMVCAK